MKHHVAEAHRTADHHRFQCDRCNKRFDKRSVIRNHYRNGKRQELTNENDANRYFFPWRSTLDFPLGFFQQERTLSSFIISFVWKNSLAG
jgi:hypothetical protein